MSSRSDGYDADERWYNDFIGTRNLSSPTDKQTMTIELIENRNPCNPKFAGRTNSEASIYISNYGC